MWKLTAQDRHVLPVLHDERPSLDHLPHPRWWLEAGNEGDLFFLPPSKRNQPTALDQDGRLVDFLNKNAGEIKKGWEP
jgi:hypothetical protein